MLTSSIFSTVGDGKNFRINDTAVTLTLVVIIDSGQISYVAVNADNTVTFNAEAYEDVFVIPALN